MIALWVPYLTTKGISMRQFMELQAVFALVILCGELLPLWSSYEGFLFYHLTMGIARSMIWRGDVALLGISDRSESRTVTGLVGGSSWPSAVDLTA